MLNDRTPKAGVPKGRAIVQGIVLLARFRVAGLAQFTGTVPDLLNSLAPLLAFPAVLALLLLLDGGGVGALSDLLSLVVGLLGPLVISQALAARWDRDEAWLRYAVAFNWCQWVLPLAAMALVLLFSVLAAMGLPQQLLVPGALLSVGFYALALHWFLARRGLDLSRVQATLFVVAVNAGTGTLMLLPRVMRGWLDGGA